MCESIVGCQGVAFMTWLWIPVLEASRSSRLSVVGYKVYGICHAQLTQRKMCKSMLTLLILANFFISDDCKRFCANHVLFCGNGFGYSFCLAIAQALQMSVLYVRAFMQAVTMTTGLLSNFLWFSCHRPESCGLTIFMLDEERQIIGPCRWFDLATQTPASERPGACCESSSGLLPTYWIQSFFLSLRKDGATVICSCIRRYHTIPYSSSPAKESARQSKWRCKKYSCIHFARGTRWCKQDIL